MSRCVQCESSTKSGSSTMSPGYCECCGFGFHMRIDQTYSNVTCRMPREQAVARGLLDTSADAVLPSTKAAFVERATRADEPPHSMMAVASAPAPSAPDPVIAACAERILAALRTEGLAGKARILAVSNVSEVHYVPAIKMLLAQGSVVQEGERRGAKYRVKP